MSQLVQGVDNNEAIDENGTWLSIGDLMSALLMIFALLLISALVQIADVAEKSKNNRVMIIKGLEDGFKAAGIDATPNPETGDISITNSVLFEQNDYQLKRDGEVFLDKFIPVYSKVVFQNKETAEEVVRIVVEGHSSSEGNFEHNMRLSVLRANSVFEYISLMDFPNKPDYLQKLLISGRGAIDSDQTMANEADRKVMFRFQFKGQEFQKVVGKEGVVRVAK
ncbi:OmpA family protein [Alteromonas hispanica]|uniref:OmpA family protein n=1 Tax=Alteromonas hispanica TaxID=315421 RepID=A0A6L9MR73_9ALTE|nr:OmpA family protein [Alteromonas hispanica]NDW20405.1 OmpA family protein [Alteromonas hispanica]